MTQSLRIVIWSATCVMALVSLGAFTAAGAQADDHRRPSSVLISPSDRQAGLLVEYTWIRRIDSDLCNVGYAWGPTTFPRPLRYRLGRDTVFIRLRKDEMPVEHLLEAWSSIRRDGSPRGTSVPVPATLSPHQRDGETVAWDLQFQPPASSEDSFLMLTVHWRDETNCAPEPDLGSQHVSWTFHLKQRPSG